MSVESDAMACDPTDTMIATSPTPRRSARQAQASVQSLAALPTTPVNVLLIGDSLVARWRAPPFAAARFGVSGDRTQHLLWRLDQPQTAEVRTKRVVLLIGTNNITGGNAPCAIASGIMAAVERIRRLWPDANLDVVGIPIRGDNKQFDAARRATNDILRKTLKDGTYIDSDTVLTCAEECASFEKDRVHLSAKGYEALGSLLTR